MEPTATPAPEHQLLVQLSSLSGERGSLRMLPDLLELMLAGADEDDGPAEPPLDIILPSDDQWQTKVYYQLVERQRRIDNEECDMMLESLQLQEPVKLHDWNIVPKSRSPADLPKTKRKPKPKPQSPQETKWTVGDIAKAGCLLGNPPIKCQFTDEHEMRSVFTLIYDVFRYKSVLNEALNDISFYQIFPKLSNNQPVVWLLLFDLNRRGFRQRETADAVEASRRFPEAGLSLADSALFTQHVKLAAAVARLRIRHNALSLSDLLPSRLKDDRISAASTSQGPVSCWVNIHKVSTFSDLCKRIENLFRLTRVDDLKNLGPSNYKWDQHCPNIVTFHTSMRAQLARSELIRFHELVVQDKSFCLGPATFGKIIKDLQLVGSVIQTHINSPRSTAYLATILSQNENIKSLMAFSAGVRKNEYDVYFENLGMSNVMIFADRLIDLSPDSAYMEEVVAIFATPPNSYSAVTDPIDLVCSRGGDLSMLEVLTETEPTKEGKARVQDILDEQRRTLRFSMSRPQIQFVLYETHSELDIENKNMVQKALRDVNKVAKIHHAALQGKLIVETPDAEPSSVVPVMDNEVSGSEINNNEIVIKIEHEFTPPLDMVSEGGSEEIIRETGEEISISDGNQSDVKDVATIDSNDKLLDGVVVPDTDIFDTLAVPNLNPLEDEIDISKEGCYLALIQRKQVIRLDNKYMIKMAENRGLFGTNLDAKMKIKASKGRKKQERANTAHKKPKKKLKEEEINRIATPTQSFLRHTRQPPEQMMCCPRCNLERDPVKISQYRRWWQETTNHIIRLRSSLARQKLIPPIRTKNNVSVRTVASRFVNTAANLDEIVSKSHQQSSKMPVYPKLRLTRNIQNKIDKNLLPVHITIVEFPLGNHNCKVIPEYASSAFVNNYQNIL